MKPHTAILVFLALFLPSLLISWGSYHLAKEHIVADLNRALALTLQEKPCPTLSEDTLRLYQSHLTIEALKPHAYLALCTEETSLTSACSDTMIWRSAHETWRIRAYASLTSTAIFFMSEQKIPLLLYSLSLLWILYAVYYFQRRRPSGPVTQGLALGKLYYEQQSYRFVDENRQAVHFTPLQQQLLTLFAEKVDRCLSVEEICQSLWPGKEDARETLYTLIRRLKKVIEKDFQLTIVSEKGHLYRLKATDSTMSDKCQP